VKRALPRCTTGGRSAPNDGVVVVVSVIRLGPYHWRTGRYNLTTMQEDGTRNNP